MTGREGGRPFVDSGFSDSGGFTDDVRAVLNATDADAETTARLQGGVHVSLPPLPTRPADSAPKAEWVEYVIALGADRGFLGGGSEHWVGHGYAKASGFAADELRALASWLGG